MGGGGGGGGGENCISARKYAWQRPIYLIRNLRSFFHPACTIGVVVDVHYATNEIYQQSALRNVMNN